MNFLRYLLLGLLALILVVLALANRSLVTLRLLPEDFGGYVGLDAAVTLPLFIVMLLAMAVGLLIGFVWEWLREHKHRAEARSQRAQKEQLEQELARTRTASDRDEVLALLDNAP
ncbi:LapA family protein [Jannaschia rubra]|uniref:Putative integral membrane protein n=1 Tax=Jannaschia rubra TaxID=282197 RepID=A0A0M6XPR8_9RHOB|nr:LapA family protein [Jannaschia rubra]CTQ32173.1 putative integral membrane protein [Jannaschia rubra]SFG35932.1 Protein of unknown function [Jannaschia rubra]